MSRAQSVKTGNQINVHSDAFIKTENAKMLRSALTRTSADADGCQGVRARLREGVWSIATGVTCRRFPQVLENTDCFVCYQIFFSSFRKSGIARVFVRPVHVKTRFAPTDEFH
jgi:hypothetical protein